MQFAVPQKHEAIRARIRQGAEQGSSARLSLAWDLGAVVVEAMFRAWDNGRGERFVTFGDWIAHDLATHVSPTEARRLAEVGVYLRGQQALVEELVAGGQVGMARLSRLANLIARHLVSAHDVEDALRSGRVLPEEMLGVFPKGKQARLYLDYPHDVGPEVRRGLTYLALRQGAASIEEALAALARDAVGDPKLPAALTPYRRRIDEGTFRCRLCGKLPLDPVEQIVGDQVLLCRTPCWSPIVEGEQPVYAERWRQQARQRQRAAE